MLLILLVAITAPDVLRLDDRTFLAQTSKANISFVMEMSLQLSD
jgi:hypothetical protein